MESINQQMLTGERALFKSRDLIIKDSVFADGESPLKESCDISIDNSIFKWKYPLWYSKNISVKNSSFLEMARSGIWYTHHISISDSIIEAPKTFRRSSDIHLTNVDMPNAQESFWSCKDVYLTNVTAKGDYFAMNSENIKIDNFRLVGNYAFDGAKNIEIRNAKLLSKDAFWNCENVTVYDSIIIGEYLGWNSKNITFINCTIESNQGMCYMDHLVIENGKMINTDLAFEYSTVDVEATTVIDSVKNPINGKIKAKNIGELILDDQEIISANTQYELDKAGEPCDL
ncbi:DUF3737 family protein [Bacillus sp. ISL-40]|uniref:DUF3737 family protein n=1 Tax=unclassified Bacillus (in: firmicutes) TaxID=185979 RepID=UPI001BE94A09|nr:MULTISPECIES: DUF3737 family protein [unclassified Bacillus (in: firmicutes)]MBT2700306.1 DUF3737 family protein [Bacillus sp. ISL-40]MBT2725151.1 DUF3737 family protein [Bacillus sp. ISL-46]MBT2742842.1 DUF3737 family protein [Bacillus sp. ISL-77]